MYIVVTGAAGFIGANVVKALNDRGVDNIIAVDNLTKADKFRNLTDCDIADYMYKDDFRMALASAPLPASHFSFFFSASFSLSSSLLPSLFPLFLITFSSSSSSHQ